ncbi:MAG TPA: LuxR C-terminal-related transcriptional regulator [Sphingomonas sp.]|nr:LuxR C-terminal-related transcriptional regulator [Sphingomonas sp.]
MDEGLAILTERERAALRLLATGHDAKSVAVELGISIHAVNERLRKGRQKLGVSSSREAARRLAAAESAPNSHVGEKIGLGRGASQISGGDRRDRRVAGASRLAFYLVGTVVMIFLAATAFVLWMQRPPADPHPHVVSTYPAEGSVIAPGAFTLTVTFDRPMLEGSMSYTRSSADTQVDCRFPATLSADRRTFTVQCSAAPGRRYEVWFNREPYMNFRSAEGVSSRPYRLRFTVR